MPTRVSHLTRRTLLRMIRSIKEAPEEGEATPCAGAYLGGALDDHSTDTYKRGLFPNGGAAYFVPPSYVPGPDFATVAANPAAAGPIPGLPGIGRNQFRGPRYFDVDATLSKSFGLPRMKVLGENGRIEFRANFFNLFNKLNLFNIQTDINNTSFGAAQDALGSRTIELRHDLVSRPSRGYAKIGVPFFSPLLHPAMSLTIP